MKLPIEKAGGQSRKPIFVYHDESESQGWLMSGLLWVYPKSIKDLVGALRTVRTHSDYWGKVHFSALSQYPSKARNAKGWFNLYSRFFYQRCWANFWGVNKRSKTWNGRKFHRDWHLSNWVTGRALLTGYRRFFNRPLEITFISDGKVRRPAEDLEGDGIATDNFESYLRHRFLIDQQKQGHTLLAPITRRPSILKPPRSEIVGVIPLAVRNSRRPDTIDEHEEVLQLVDLLLGSVMQAFTASSKSENYRIKRELAQSVVPLIEPEYKSPHFDRISISCWPTDDGGFFQRPYPLEIRQTSKQRQSSLIDF